MRVSSLSEWIDVSLDPFPVVCSVGCSLSHTCTDL